MSKRSQKPARGMTSQRGGPAKLVMVLAVVALAAVVAALALTGGGSNGNAGGDGPKATPTPDPHATPVPTPSAAPLLQEAPATAAGGSFPRVGLYQEIGQGLGRLHRVDLRTGEDELLIDSEEQLFVPPAGDYLAYATEDDGAVLHLRNIETGKETTVPGAEPLKWSWDGRWLLVSVQGAEAPGLGVVGVADMEVTPLDFPPALQWVPIGWAGDRLLMFRRPGEALFLVSPDGTMEPVPTPDGEIREPAPSGDYVFAISHQDDAVFQPIDGTRPTVVDLGDWRLGGLNPWSGNDLLFVAVATGFELDSPSAVLALDPTGESWVVPNTEGAVAAYPSGDGSGFVLVRGKSGESHQLWSCLPTGGCKRSPATMPLGAKFRRVG